MNIKSVHVENFRSIKNETLHCGDLTALVGRNGAGKSAFLNAIDLFYSGSEQISITDFYNDDPTNDIVITITFTALSESAKELFSSRIEGDNLTVAKIISWDNGSSSSSYHGSTLQHPEISRIRKAVELKDRGETAKKILNELKNSGEFDDLPDWTTISGTLEELSLWEQNHPEECIRLKDDGQFFGFKQVGQGYLGRFTRRLFIRAVHDATEEAVEGRNSVFSDLIDLVVRSVLYEKEELADLKERFQSEYEEIINPDQLPELNNLEGELTSTLKVFVPDSKILLDWDPLEELEVPAPKADMKVVEDGYPAPIENCGHGLQRAFVLTIFQHLTKASYSKDLVKGVDEEHNDVEKSQSSVVLPNLVLLIEEPELYQHPSRQRYFASILHKLSQSGTYGVSDETQIIYSTHSPHFVGLDRLESIRLLRKLEIVDDYPKITKVIRPDLDDVAEQIWDAAGQPGDQFTGKTLKPRLKTIMTPWMNEGFFSDLVVLVEGEDDRAAILGMAIVEDIDFDSQGIAVIPCGGKTNIDRPLAIFKSLDILVYAIWDSDMDEEDGSVTNRLLLNLLDAPEEDWPSGVYEDYACFINNLDDSLRSEIGADLYDEIIKDCKEEFSIPKKSDAIKNPHVIAELIRRASKDGKKPETLEKIVEAILAKSN